MYNNSIVNFQESTTILNACTKKCGDLLKAPRIYIYIYIYIYTNKLDIKGSVLGCFYFYLSFLMQIF